MMANKNPNIHECAEMPGGGITVAIQNDGTLDGPGQWNLIAIREATEADLEENHHLELVGDSIWTFSAEIRFCPYCGLKLPVSAVSADSDVQSEEESDSFGAFSLFDQEAWHGRLR
jgi:NADH pyrophosphatase NudC (nudix superfamily)